MSVSQRTCHNQCAFGAEPNPQLRKALDGVRGSPFILLAIHSLVNQLYSLAHEHHIHLHSHFTLQYINLTPSLKGNCLYAIQMAFQMKNKGNSLLSRETWFKALFRSQVKISLVLLSFLTVVLLTQLLLIQAQSGVTGSPGSKAGCPWLKGRGYCL